MFEKINQANQSFRLAVKAELVDRVRKNPRYSLRSLARSIGVHPGSLSQFLNGKRRFSVDTMEDWSRRLQFSPKKHQSIFSEIHPFRPIELDLFALIGDWIHYAILELTRVKGFVSDHKWVAKELGLSPFIAEEAINRLFRLDLLKIDENGQWVDDCGNVDTIEHNHSNSAMVKLQKQILKGAIKALEQIPLKQRHQSSITFAGHPDDLAEIESMIRKFRKELTRFIDSREKKDRVYQFSISLFPAKLD